MRGSGLRMVNEIPGFWVFWEIFSLARDTAIIRNTRLTILKPIIIMNPSSTIMSLSTITSLSIITSVSITITNARPGMVTAWVMEADITADTTGDMDMAIMDIIHTVTIIRSIVITMDMVMSTVTDMNLTINRMDIDKVCLSSSLARTAKLVAPFVLVLTQNEGPGCLGGV